MYKRQTLDGGRIGIASQALGIAEGAIDETVAYVKERKQFGRSIAQFQDVYKRQGQEGEGERGIKKYFSPFLCLPINR